MVFEERHDVLDGRGQERRVLAAIADERGAGPRRFFAIGPLAIQVPPAGAVDDHRVVGAAVEGAARPRAHGTDAEIVIGAFQDHRLRVGARALKRLRQVQAGLRRVVAAVAQHEEHGVTQSPARGLYLASGFHGGDGAKRRRRQGDGAQNGRAAIAGNNDPAWFLRITLERPRPRVERSIWAKTTLDRYLALRRILATII
jgi:hypothetical protein